MNILIAGGAGYVGSALVPSLQKQGHNITVVDLFWFGNHLPPSITILKKDLFHLTVDDLKNFDQVIFLGGLSNDPMAEYAPQWNFIFNNAAPTYLAYIAKQAGVRRYIYACTCSVYGFNTDRPCDESTPAVSQFPYGVSKLQGESGCMHFADEDFSVISLRKGTVSGVSPRMRFDLLINTMCRSAIVDQKIFVSNPDIRRPMLGIRDAVDAYNKAIHAPLSLSGVFNIASCNTTVGSVALTVQSVMQDMCGSTVPIETHHQKNVRCYEADTTKARVVLGLQPKETVESIARDVIAARDTFGDLHAKNYSNIEVFKTILPKDTASIFQHNSEASIV